MTAEHREKSFGEKTPADLRADFRRNWKLHNKGNFPVPQEGQTIDEATMQIDAYEVFVDPLNEQER